MVADYLSRPNPNQEEGEQTAAVTMEVEGDPQFRAQLAQAATRADEETQQDLVWHEGLPFMGEKLFVGDDEGIKQQLLTEAHTAPISGHFAPDKTLRRLRALYTWKYMPRDVVQFCERCVTCAKTHKATGRSLGLLHPLPISLEPWEDISLDFITKLPITAGGNDTLMVVCDRFSRQLVLIPTKETVDATDAAKLLLEHGSTGCPGPQHRTGTHVSWPRRGEHSWR